MSNMIRTLFLTVAISLMAPAMLTAENEFRFEVVSIHLIKRGAGTQVAITMPTPNGFTATTGMWQLLEFAYGPPVASWKVAAWQSTEVRNEPGWVNQDIYSINARVSQADVKAWQSQNPNTHDLLHAALRSVLKDRFKLVAHEEPAKRTIFELVIAKSGPHLKQAVPGTTLPLGVKLESGGVMTGMGARGEGGWDFRAATMKDLADSMLQIFFDGPVRDRTGLTGRYDFQVPRVPTPGENNGYGYSVDRLGLALKRSTENRPVLVIDHVERPTSN